jgi:hypothetical protein
MGIEVKERKAPRKLDSKVARLIADAKEAGFSELGWLSVKVFSPLGVIGFANPEGTVVLTIAGMTVQHAFQAAAIDLVSELASGDMITTSTTGSINSQPERGIFKYLAPAKSSVRKLVDEHARNLKKHKSKAVLRPWSLKKLADFIKHYLTHEMDGLLVRHWLTPPPAAAQSSAKTGSVEGGYISALSKTIRVALENGQYMWGGWDINDSGTYKVMSQNDHACVVSFKSSLGGAKRIEITREGKKYLFTELPERYDPEVFTRADGAEFLADSKDKSKIEKPDLGTGTASWTFLPVEKTIEKFEKGFLQNVRKEVIPLLVRAEILTGKLVNKKLHVLDDDAFRRTMRLGIEKFAQDKQGWSFVAFKAPFESVAKALRGRKDVSNYRENVGASTLDTVGAWEPDSEDKRHVFLTRFRQSDWTILLQTIHWIEMADFALGSDLGEDVSKRLKCMAIVAADSDAGGSAAAVYTNGKKGEDFSTEKSSEEFYALFYTEGIFLPESFIAANKKQARLHLRDPASAERIDYMQVALPETA